MPTMTTASEQFLNDLLRPHQEGGVQHIRTAEAVCTRLFSAVEAALLNRNDPRMTFSYMALAGSTASGLCLSTHSDIDVVLMIESSMAEDEVTWCTEVKLVELVFTVVREAAEAVGFLFNEQVMHTKVPVLKMRCVHSDKEIDISVNRQNSIHNTHLLMWYCRLEPRVQPFIQLIKLWAKQRGVCNPRNATLSSYAWTLLALHFLQRTSSPVVPALPIMYTYTRQAPTPDLVLTWQSTNTCGLAELLLQFFAFFGGPRSDATDFVIDVRFPGRRFPKRVAELESGLDDEDAAVDVPELSLRVCPPWRICIEDPVLTNYDLGRVIHREDGMSFIRKELRRGFDLLHASTFHDLASSQQFWVELFATNNAVPSLPLLCNTCEGEAHAAVDCPMARCHICKGKGHSAERCTKIICRRCQGDHLVAQCHLTVAEVKNAAAVQPTALSYATVCAAPATIAAASRPPDNESRYHADNEPAAVLSKTAGNGSTLLYTVLSWTADMFCDDKLLVTHLPNIPMEFADSSEWYSTFYPFVLEEQRAQLQAVADKGFKDAVDYNATVIGQHNEDSDLLRKLFVLVPRGAVNEALLFNFPFALGVFIKKSAAKGSLNGLSVQRLQSAVHVLVNIEFPPREYHPIYGNPAVERCNVFNAVVAKSKYSNELIEAGAKDWDFYMLWIGTLSAIRICDALHRAEDPPAIMLDVTSGRPQRVGSKPLVINSSTVNRNTAFEPFTKKLNNSQRETIARILQVGFDPDQPVIQLIKGPPGTGKTSTLVALLRTMMHCNLRIHATAPTNVAVCELARKTLSASKAAISAGLFRKPDCRWRLADFLLAGTVSRLKVGATEDPLFSILLEARLERLDKVCVNCDESIRTLLGVIRGHAANVDDEQETVVSSANIGQRTKDALTQLVSAIDVVVNEGPMKAKTGLSRAQLMQMQELYFSILRIADNTLTAWFNGAVLDEKTASMVNLQLSSLEDLLLHVSISLPANIKEAVLSEASIVFSTVNVGGRELFNYVYFDVAVVDEATQLVQAETAIVLRKGVHCLILAGDDKQLPATVTSSHCKKSRYDASLFGRLLQLQYPYHLLDTQYRMHPHISRWPRTQFYEGRVVDGDNVLSSVYDKPWHNVFPPLAFYDLRAGQEEVDETGSKFNEAEAVLVTQLLAQIRKLGCSISVGIISPYAAQVNRLIHLQKLSLNDNSRVDVNAEMIDSGTADLTSATSEISVRVCTVDSFQGQECDIIIFSTVRSNKGRKLGFLKDERRLNVAITRARFSLIVVGSAHTLASDDNWHGLVTHTVMHNFIAQSSNNTLLRKATVKWETSERRVQQLQQSKAEVFESSPWAVLLGSELKNSMTKLSGPEKTQLLRAMLALANGEWPKHELKCSLVSEPLQGIVHVYKVGPRRLVWSVDVNQSTFKQCLRMWDLVTEVRLAHTIRHVENGLRNYTSEYLERCAFQLLMEGEARMLYEPKVWREAIVWYKTKDVLAREAQNGAVEENLDYSHVTESATLTKFFPLSSAVARLLSSSNQATAIELPFEMSVQEEAIVRKDGSVFVLGRSGTGKTTVMLHRMFLYSKCSLALRENSSSVPDGDEATICRQLMVTASPILCEAIRQHYRKMCRSAQELDKIEEAAASKVVLKLGHDYEAQNGPVDFMHCTPADYPLIVTFATFVRMLDATMPQSFFAARRHRRHDSYGDEDDDGFVHHSSAGCEVDFERFANYYFSRFPEKEVKAVGDAALFYTEIMSHIKGSVQAMHNETGFLSREQYKMLSKQRSSTLNEAKREIIYDMFLVYKRMQGYYGDYDLQDVVAHIYSVGKQPGAYRGHLMFSVFVDEVQDLTPAQISLFQFVCGNPKGFVFAGDTAQTIAHGVGFRFETVKDIFYNEFLRGDEDKQLMPEIAHLSRNFRTHSGVVNLANSVVRLIVHFFEYSIDRLEPESSTIGGPLPIFLEGEDVVDKLFSKDGGELHSSEFGAEQAILVRDDAAKEAVKRITGSDALVLTVLEAKGMEFTDCLVYNVFKSSPFAANNWRVLYEYTNPSVSHPKFDAQQHSALCLELKLLYVLLTRARQHLVIFDESDKASEPMRSYWLANELVVRRPFDDNVRAMFLKSSTAEEWKARGAEFFERKQYSNARMCYGRAGDMYHEQLCKAADLEQQGDKEEAKSAEKARKLFAKAAEVFLSLPDVLWAARCFEKAHEFVKAANLYNEKNRFHEAARCFEMGGKWVDAAVAYDKVDDVRNTLRCCSKPPPEFELAMRYIDSFGQRKLLSETELAVTLKEWTKKGALHFHAAGNSAKMMSFVHKFPATAEKRSFLHRYDYAERLLEIEIQEGNFREAARIYEGLFDFPSAAEYYERSGCIVGAVRCGLSAIKARCLDSRFLPAALPLEDRNVLQKVMGLASSGVSVVEVVPPAVQLELELLMSSNSLPAIMSVSQRAAAVSVDAWPVQFNATRLFFAGVSSAAPAHTSSKSSSKPATANSEVNNIWHELLPLCKSAYSVAAAVIGSLKLLTPAKGSRAPALSSADQRRVMQTLEFFGLVLDDKQSNLTSLDARFVSGFSSMAGYSHFGGHAAQSKKPKNATAETQKGVAIATVRYQVKEVAQRAVVFFENETKALLTTVANSLNKDLETLFARTFTQYERRFLQPAIKMRPVVNLPTKRRIEIMLELLSLYALPLSASSGKANAVRGLVVDTVLPRIPCVEDRDFLVSQWTHDGPVRNVLRQHRSEFKPSDLRYQTIARLLLMSELTNDLSAVANALAKSLGHEDVPIDDERLVLVTAFQWECVTSPDNKPYPNWMYGSFFFSLISGSAAIANHVFSKSGLGPIFSAPSGAGGRSSNNVHSDCLSPISFVCLVEKYFVWLLLHMKIARNVILPTSLVHDTLHRQSLAYSTAIKGFVALGGEPFRNPLAADAAYYAGDSCYKLMHTVVLILERMTESSFSAWLKVSQDKIKGTETEERNSFLSRLVVLPLLYAVNRNKNDRIREIYSGRISRAANRSGSALSRTPHFLNALLNANPMQLHNTIVDYYRNVEDPLLSLHCLRSPPRPPAGHHQLTRMIIVTSEDKQHIVSLALPYEATTQTATAAVEEELTESMVSKEALELSLEATIPQAEKSKEERMEEIRQIGYNVLRGWLAAARIRLSKLTATEVRSRYVEREFITAGAKRTDANYYNTLLSPLYVQTCELSAQLEAQIELLRAMGDRAIETVDMALDAAASLQQCLTDLTPDFILLLRQHATADGSSSLELYAKDVASSVEGRIAEHIGNAELSSKIGALIATKPAPEKRRR